MFGILTGKLSGLRNRKMFNFATNIIIIMTGSPIPVIVFQLAIERANKRECSSRKQKRRYKTANQRYLSRIVLFVFVLVTGMEYHSRIPVRLKKNKYMCNNKRDH